MTGTMLTSPDYQAFLESLKERVRTARLRAAQSLNQEIVLLYWSIGCDILARQAELGWGAGVIDRLSEDLRREFPDMKGFSPRNLRYMKAFAQAWQDEAILQQRVAKLPWGHIVRILDGAREPAARQFYVEQALACGWSRDVLVLHMDRRLHERQGQAATNFDRTLPSSTSDLAVQTLVVVELKAGAFKPEHAGKLNFYLSAVDDLVRDKDKDGPTIGLLLCRTKNRVLAEYALRDIHKPIGVADIQLTRLLPENLEQALPTVEALEAELSDLPDPADLPASEKE